MSKLLDFLNEVTDPNVLVTIQREITGEAKDDGKEEDDGKTGIRIRIRRSGKEAEIVEDEDDDSN